MTLVRWTHGFSSECLLKGSVLTIGNFDGLHHGHCRIVSAAVQQASMVGLPSVALTFDPHPSTIISPLNSPRLLMTLDEKLIFLNKLGVNYGWALMFSQSISELSPKNFMEALVTSVMPESIHVGEGFRFGYRRSGSSDFMLEWGKVHGIHVVTYPLEHLDGEPISSSRIRLLLNEGNIVKATQLLGRPYSLSGTVIAGFKRGRSLGFPTANLKTDLILPKSGVYITSVRSLMWEGEKLGLTNIGIQPTFKDGDLTVETHCPDGFGDWYGSHLQLDFLYRIRDEKKFDSSEDLQIQILKDIDEGKQWWTQAHR